MKFKKPKFWDFKKPSLISYLFFPFTFILIINNFFLKLIINKKKKFKKIKQFVLEIYIWWNRKNTFSN